MPILKHKWHPDYRKCLSQNIYGEAFLHKAWLLHLAWIEGRKYIKKFFLLEASIQANFSNHALCKNNPPYTCYLGSKPNLPTMFGVKKLLHILATFDPGQI